MDKYYDMVSVVIVAAGSGKRMSSSVKKQFMLLGDKPVLWYSVASFEHSSYVKDIVLVVPNDDIEYCQDLMKRCGITKVTNIVAGGATRQESVYHGICSICNNTEFVVVHDGARPFVSCVDLKRLIVAASECGSATFGVDLKDTIKVKNDRMEVKKTLNRNELVAIQTPQAFDKDKLKLAHVMAKKDGYCATDDTVLLERLGIVTRVIEGSNYNIKITTQDDLVIASVIKQKLNL